MQLVAIEVEGFGSVRTTRVACGHLTVLAGECAFGEDTIAGLRLLRAAAEGEIGAAVRRELDRRRGRLADRVVVTLRLEGLAYRIAVRVPNPRELRLGIGPMVVSEHVIEGVPGRWERILMERRGSGVWLLDAAGRPAGAVRRIEHDETALSVVGAAGRLALVTALREGMRSWTFEGLPTSSGLVDRQSAPITAAPSISQGWSEPAGVVESERQGPRLAIFTTSHVPHGERQLGALSSVIWRASHGAQVVIAEAPTELVELLDSRRFPDAVIHRPGVRTRHHESVTRQAAGR